MITYKHIRPNNSESYYNECGTFAVEVPDKDTVMACDEPNINVLSVQLGVAVLSDQDQFNKSIGRKVAKGRMEQLFLTYQGEFGNDIRMVKQFVGSIVNPRTKQTEQLVLLLSVSPLSKWVKLENVVMMQTPTSFDEEGLLF